MKIILFSMILVFSSNLLASNSKVNNDMISIDGSYSKRQMSRSERMKAIRSKLERRTEQVVQKKIEELRFQQELELSKKIQQAFNQKMKALDDAFEDDDQNRSNL